MTLVNAETGEVIEALDVAEARNLTDAIAGQLEFTWDLVVEAYQRQAHAALGYDSWNHYCTQEFGASSLKLPKEDRRDTVASLRDAGLSTRAIGAAVGTSEATVRRDLAGASNDAPGRDEVEPRFKKSQITGTDGKSYSKTTTRESKSTTTETAPTTAGKEGAGAGRSAAPSEPDAETIARAVERGTDPALTYRVNVDKALGKAHDLVQIDVEKAIATAGESATGHRHLVQSIHRWCDRYLKESGRPDHLRSVK